MFSAMLDPIDLGELEVDAVVELCPARAHDLGRIGESERNEQQARLIDVTSSRSITTISAASP